VSATGQHRGAGAGDRPRGPGGRSESAHRNGPFRAHARRSVRLRALLTHVRAGWQRQALVENLGLGGARVVAEEFLTAGDPVTISFTAPTLWDPLVLRARVAWVAPVTSATPPLRAGLAFEHKSPEAVFALFELIVTLGYE
jgi:hypothetical protein